MEYGHLEAVGPAHLQPVVEARAAARIFGLLPGDLGQELMALWAEFEAAQSRDAVFAKALDRVLTSGRYVIPIWYQQVGRIAHSKALHYPEKLPLYGDWIGFQPEVWWYQE